jgi:hypothetical protein
MDLDLSLLERPRRAALRHDGNRIGRQAHYVSAGAAHEVGVVIPMACTGAHLETPDMVTQVRTMQQPRFGQIHQVAIDGGAIARSVSEPFYHFRMRQWRLCLVEQCEDGQTWARALQAPCAELLAELLGSGHDTD